MKHRKFSARRVLTILILVLISGSSLVNGVSASAAMHLGTEPEYVKKVLNKDKLTEISIEIKQADWDWLIKNASKKESRSCTVKVNGKTFFNVAIKPKGNSSLMMVSSSKAPERYSFKLDFGAYMEGQTCFGLRKISLNNMVTDKTYMKEYLSYDLFDQMGVASPAFAFSNISINGSDKGLYLAVEGVDETFIERQFGTSEGNLYKPEIMDMGGDNAGKPNFPNFNKNKDQKQPFDNQNAPKNVPQGDTKNSSPKDGIPNGDMPLDNMPPGGMPPGDMPEGGVPPQGGMSEGGMPQGNNVGEKGAGFQGGPGGGFPGGFGGGFGGGTGTDLKYNGDSISNYSGIRDNAVLKTTTDNDFKKVIKMIKNLNSGTDLEEYLDVDNVLRYFAVNTFLVNLDSYAGGMYHNYYLYEKDGCFKILPWDLNMSFAGMSMNDASKAVNFPIDKPVTTTLENAPLIGKLLEVPKYKETYHKYLDEIVSKYVNSGIYESSIAKAYKLINDSVKKDTNVFYTYEDFKNSIPVLTTFGKDRAKSITAQLKGEQPSTEYGKLSTTVDLNAMGSMQMGGLGGDHSWGGKNGKAMPGMDGMPDFQNIQSAMSIINEANGKELNADQKEKLKKLGVDEKMVAMMKNMGAGGGPPSGNIGKMPVFGGSFTPPGNDSKAQIIIIFVSFAFLIAGMLFVFKFKRKKFRSI